VNAEPAISENNSSSSDLGFDDDNQNTSSESNQASAVSVGAGASNSKPDGDCLFDPSLPKCATDEVGNCHDGFGMNKDDESGRCIPHAIP